MSGDLGHLPQPAIVVGGENRGRCMGGWGIVPALFLAPQCEERYPSADGEVTREVGVRFHAHLPQPQEGQ